MRRSDFVWHDVASPFALRLAIDVVERLRLQAVEGLKALPKRGLEVGGILMGSRQTAEAATSVLVRDFEAVESEHKAGPSYQLSDADLDRFTGTFRSRPDAVGIYRTQTRVDTLDLQPGDAEFFQSCFHGTEGLFLLVHPASSQAAIFLPGEGSLRLAYQFPFRGADLVESGAVETVDEADPVVPLAETPARSRASAVPRWLIPAGAVLAGALAGAAIVHRPSKPAAAPVVATPISRQALPPTASKPSPDSDALALHVQREGRSLRVVWDGNSPVGIASHSWGILHHRWDP